jgi:6-phosphogluconolactonase
MGATRWHDVHDVVALHGVARDRIVAAAERAIAARGRFLIVLCGGGTPRGVYRLLRETAADWAKWHVYYGDERCVPPESPERSSRMAAQLWLDHVAIPPGQIHVVPAERGPEEGARAYATALAGVGDFDLVLLGLGEDGHTASLFPGHPLDGADVLPVTDAPKPPPARVSLSAARLGRAREVIFLVDGIGKLDAVARWQRGEPLPATAIDPPFGVDVLLTVNPSQRSAD